MQELSYRIVRSNRKTIGIYIVKGQLEVRCPRTVPPEQIRSFVESHRSWIEKHFKNTAPLPSFTPQEVQSLADKALELIPPRVAYFAQRLGVTYGNITIRNQRTKWGSCSSKGNLNFNCVLALVPPWVLDYVVVHELCHRKHMNHSPDFWAEVEKEMPDYAQLRKWLKDNGESLIGRL